MRILSGAVAVGILLGVAACSDRPAARTCVTHTDCPTGSYCGGSFCEIDATAPSASKRLQPPADSNLGVGDPIEIAFSEPMAPTVTQDGPVTISASCGTIVWSKELSTDGLTLTLRAVSTPSPPCTINVQLTNACTDLARNSLPATSLSWFMPLQWQPLGDPLATDAGSVAIAVPPDGNPIVAYVGGQGTASANVYVKKWNGSSWISLGGALGTAPAGRPAIALDATGNPSVAWIEGSAAPRSLKVKKWVSGSGFWSALPVITASDPRSMSVAISPTAVTWVAYSDFFASADSTRCNFAYQFPSPSGPWAQDLKSECGWPGGTSVRTDSTEVPLVAHAWIDGSGFGIKGNTTYASFFSYSGVFETAIDPSLAVNSRGAAVAWLKYSNDFWGVYAARWVSGGLDVVGLTTASKLNSVSVPPSTSLSGSSLTGPPSIAVAADGAPVVAWVEPKAGVFAKRLTSSGWTLVGQRLNTADLTSDTAFAPAIATDNDGDNLSIAWNEDGVLRVARYEQ